MSAVKKITFEDRTGDGEGPWVVSVDGQVVIDELRSQDMDVSDGALEPLWKAIGVELTFDWVGK